MDRDLYASALHNAGFATTVDESVDSAAGALQTAELPDVIVLELRPEPIAAWSFVERQRVAAPDVPFVILTSMIRPDRAYRLRAQALGCAAFVAKPCSLPLLVDVVSRVRQGTRGLEISRYDV